MGGKRQKNQLLLAFMVDRRGEAPTSADEGTEPPAASCEPQSPAATEHLMEAICERENMVRAWKRVCSNRGGAGVDGLTIRQTHDYLVERWASIREHLLAGTYRPHPVRRAEISKETGGMRKLGIPTVADRLIQQAMLQVLGPLWDPTFCEESYGFRPGRSAHQAVAAAQEYLAAGRRWVVDIDLEKFFDRVNHDKLMGRVAGRVADKRLLRLIRAFLHAGVVVNGLVSPTIEGTPQGGPLSPLLSNIVLDDLDRELQRRGLRFVRYADDCNIYVRSRRAGQRVMASISRFISRKLKLRVNQSKSAVARPWERKFLGFSFTDHHEPKRRISPQALKRFKTRIRQVTRRTRAVSLSQMIGDLAPYLRGWRAYFGFCQTPHVLKGLDGWIRRRLRCVVWKQWKRGPTRYEQLRQRGVSAHLAASTAGSAHGPWRLSHSLALSRAMPTVLFHTLGLPTLMSADA